MIRSTFTLLGQNESIAEFRIDGDHLELYCRDNLVEGEIWVHLKPSDIHELAVWLNWACRLGQLTQSVKATP